MLTTSTTTNQMGFGSSLTFPLGAGDARDYVRELRLRLAQYKIRSAELAREAGMPRSQLSRLFNDEKSNPTLDTITRLEQALTRILTARAKEAEAEIRARKKVRKK